MTIKKADGTDYKKVVTKESGVTAHMTDKSGIAGFEEATGGYLRTPTNGLLPNVSGGSGYVGTNGWPFNYGYFKNDVYVNGIALAKQSEVPLIGYVNGWYYYKFPSGLLIQNRYVSSTIPSFNTWGNIYGYDITESVSYPIYFVETPIRLVSNSGDGTANFWGTALSSSGIDLKTKFGNYTIQRGTQYNNLNCQRFLTAIGRWK